jgi:FkbM family methyltransferase
VTARSVLLAPVVLLQKARATRRILRGAPVPKDWARRAAAAQVRLTARVARRRQGLVQARVAGFDVTGFSIQSLAFLHYEIFVALEYYFRASRPDPLIIDGGSNIGMSVLFFKALYPKSRVLAFEPAERAYELLVRNVEENRLAGVELHRAALGGAEGTIAFYEELEDPATFRMSTRRERIDGAEVEVPQVRLSDFINEPVDLLKLDVEGAEDEVLTDLIDSAAIAHIQQLVVEYHHHLDPERDFLGAFLERLREQGFRYQVSAREPIVDRAAVEPVFQDVLVHAFRTNSPST